MFIESSEGRFQLSALVKGRAPLGLAIRAMAIAAPADSARVEIPDSVWTPIDHQIRLITQRIY
jgi:hypothetical protein